MLLDVRILLGVEAMSRRWVTVILILAMVGGGLYALYTWNSAPSPPPPLAEIDRVTGEAREALLTAQRAASEAMTVRHLLAKEVRAKNEAIHKEVFDYDADRIARELNIFCYGER